MSELINAQSLSDGFRRSLLTNVSVLALIGAVCAPSGSLASPDEDRPTVWIELGGQLERVDTPQTIFAPPFFDLASPSVNAPLTNAQRPSRYSPGLDGEITFAPKTTNWLFSVAIRYGRAKNARHLHYQTPGQPSSFGYKSGVRTGQVHKPILRDFGDGQTNFDESHLILDFHAGKDIGLGILGSGGNSVLSVGVRYAQFTSRSDATLHARPVYGHGPLVQTAFLGKYYTRHKPFHQTYTALAHTTRNTHAVGPSVSWDGSMPIIGRESGMTIAFDWGVNAAALFGRQRVHEAHQTTGYHLYYDVAVKRTSHYAHATARDRSRSIVIPNVGGFAGLSLKFPNAKLSLGYRGDFFFNATDAGLDVRDEANRNFYGPFATISIGLGG